eukprot:CAMPEP_0197439058 /NCGR_PEP_ID=MMETSP1175-20131217/5879_1 /TAXON_ID=1003142 /ORGANISM="Triceratium dubium, Strain CCMP147" /LENGTH=547 /DNA_ID=CAMNT_0042968889 /DNA_START=52 /DNA_END=1695 /DNA_ORIENTATION=+
MRYPAPSVLLCLAAAVPPDAFASAAGDNATAACNCDGCPKSSNEILGRHTTLVSPTCPEGSVATVTKLRTASTSGDYELLTWNTGGWTYTDDILGGPYKYRRATAGEDDEVTCFGLDESELPVVGDQPQIEVKLNCESVECDFLYDVEFGCAETGVLGVDVARGGGVQVLSDVDDTIKCPFPQCAELRDCSPLDVKHYLAGVDVRLEDGEFYPGVAELMLGLALGPGANATGNATANETTSAAPPAFVPAKPMLLSARPNEFNALLGISQDNDLNQYYERVGRREDRPSYGVNVDSSMYGTITDGTSHTEFGQTKARHYNDVSTKRPNTRFAFLGDNGQGDVCAAQSMLESRNGGRMVAVLIHESQPDPAKVLTECQQPDGDDFTLTLSEGDYNGAVHFHKTHSDAALWALNRGLLSCCSAESVHHAVAEWAACRCEPEEGNNATSSCAYNDTIPPPTGPYHTPETRASARAYCADVESDQKALAAGIALCDPSGGCAASRSYVPGEFYVPGVGSFSAAAAPLSPGKFALAAAASLLLQGMLSNVMF